jgi:sporulation protein YlmC with PRC-barrel domain
MRAMLLAGTAIVALGAVGSAVWADSANNNANNPNHQNLRSSLTQMLQKSGYTDIRVAPASFLVRAKDDQGDPVMMSISPDQFTEVAEVTGSSSGNSSHAADVSNTQNGGGSNYVSVPGQDDLSSKVVGLDVTNNDNKDIGTIKDIALNPNGRAAAYIVSVGGFLGIGDHYVAVNPSAVKVSYNDNTKKWAASMNATADQLKSAPEFKYTGKWSSGRT